MTITVALSAEFASKEALLRLAQLFVPLRGTHLFLSGGDNDQKEPRCSFLTLCPYETLSVHRGNAVLTSVDGSSMQALEKGWKGLKELLFCDRSTCLWPEWVGYFSYEMGKEKHSRDEPEAFFYRCGVCLCVDHVSNRATVYLQEGIAQKVSKEWTEIAMPDYWKSIRLPGLNTVSEPNFKTVIPFEERESYYLKVLEIQEKIRKGEVYQVNLSHRCVLEGEIDSYALFTKLALINPAPFSVFAHTSWGTILSSSPERLLRRKGNHLETRPIKGTIARGTQPNQDKIRKVQLLNSEKDRAELMMITDLMRNDLSLISEQGSVNVKELVRCEKYTNVYHLLSVIESKAIEGLNAVDAIQACFPGGSITGCPKKAAIETIDQLEKRSRGVYTGSIGYFCGNGDFDFNIAIRTLTYRDNSLEIALGGAVVIDSDPIAEYEETLAKGHSIFKALC